MEKYIKSVIWLLGAGGLSYSLYRTITPNDSDLRKYLPEGQIHHRPDLNNQPTFVESLRNAALVKRSMIKKETESESSKSPNTPSSVGK